MRKIKSLLVVLILAGCGGKDHSAHGPVTSYACPMHPQIVRDQPGNCPICGMALVKINTAGVDASLMLSESQIKLANITTTLTHMEMLSENTILTGELVVNEEETEVISSRVQGRIEKLFFKEVGQRVVKGQALYEIYSEQLLTLQQEYLLTLRQAEELKEKRFESFVKAAEKKLLLLGMTKDQLTRLASEKKTNPLIIFYAPVAGVVVRMDAAEGQYVSEGSSLYRIEKLDKVWVEAELFPGEAKLVRRGDLVRIKVNGFENIAVDGIVTFLSPEYLKGTQVIALRALMDNPKMLFQPGMEATVILSHSAKEAIALPVDAVVRDGKGSHVWILADDGSFRPRIVKTGLENFERVEITEGLQEKENVVITGAYLLYSELVLKKGGDPMAGHIH